MINKSKKMFIEKDKCTGCTACSMACPQKCITMEQNDEGFFYPMIDNTKCISCHICERTCPVLNKQIINNDTIAYAAINKNEKDRMNSSSGGVFSILARYVINELKGVVVGAAYGDNFIVKHIIINDVEDLCKLQGSKYSQSYLDDIFVKVKQILKDGRYVLFSGTPCQIGGLKAYLAKNYDNLICVDLICHGVPSPLIWQKYIEYRLKIDNEKAIPKSINLRCKNSGWSRYNFSVLFDYEDNKYQCVNYNDPYMKVFTKNYCLRPSCSNCHFKGINRSSDFTLGDYWGVWNQIPEMDDDKGTSLLFVHSGKAHEIFTRIKDEIYYKIVDANEAVKGSSNMIYSSETNRFRNQFMKDMQKKGFKYAYEKDFLNITIKHKIKSKIKEILR